MFGWEAFGEYTVDHTFFSSISWIHWDFFFNTIQKYTHSYWIESVSVESAVGFIHISDFIPFKISLQTISLRYERAHKSERSIVVRTRTTWNHLLFNFIWTIHFRIRQLNLVHLHFSLIYFSCKMCFWRANLMAPQSNSNFVSVCFFFQNVFNRKWTVIPLWLDVEYFIDGIEWEFTVAKTSRLNWFGYCVPWVKYIYVVSFRDGSYAVRRTAEKKNRPQAFLSTW